MTQLTLFEVSQSSQFADLAPHVVNTFWRFHEENPHVFELFKKFTADLRAMGFKRYGIGSITERIRWHIATETRNDEFKINNNHRSCYARLLILDNPELAQFFSTRESRKAA
jgi:hypothetical protein